MGNHKEPNRLSPRHFSGLGRSGDTNSYRNPAASVIVQRYLKQIKEEQAKGHSIMVHQAIPLFEDKLELIGLLITRHLGMTTGTTYRFLLLRDAAFFTLQHSAGDRAGDLGLMWAREIKRLGNGGFLICHT